MIVRGSGPGRRSSCFEVVILRLISTFRRTDDHDGRFLKHNTRACFAIRKQCERLACEVFSMSDADPAPSVYLDQGDASRWRAQRFHDQDTPFINTNKRSKVARSQRRKGKKSATNSNQSIHLLAQLLQREQNQNTQIPREELPLPSVKRKEEEKKEFPVPSD